MVLKFCSLKAEKDYMRSILVVLFFIFLVGCDKGEVRRYNSTDDVFSSFVTSFIDDYKSFTGKQINFDVAINFYGEGEAGFMVLAHCYVYSTKKNEILIDPDRWETLSEVDKKALIYHELGHCALGYDHRDDMIPVGEGEIKASIMHTSSRNTLRTSHPEVNEFYLAEFFHNDKSVWELFKYK